MKEGYNFYTRDTFSIISSIFFLFEEKNSMVYHIFSHFRINQSSNILWIKFLKFNLKIWVFQIDIQSGKTITAPCILSKNSQNRKTRNLKMNVRRAWIKTKQKELHSLHTYIIMHIFGIHNLNLAFLCWIYNNYIHLCIVYVPHICHTYTY